MDSLLWNYLPITYFFFEKITGIVKILEIMKIPETPANVGAYYGNEENGQWQVIIHLHCNNVPVTFLEPRHHSVRVLNFFYIGA